MEIKRLTWEQGDFKVLARLFNDGSEPWIDVFILGLPVRTVNKLPVLVHEAIDRLENSLYQELI